MRWRSSFLIKINSIQNREFCQQLCKTKKNLIVEKNKHYSKIMINSIKKSLKKFICSNSNNHECNAKVVDEIVI